MKDAPQASATASSEIRTFIPPRAANEIVDAIAIQVPEISAFTPKLIAQLMTLKRVQRFGVGIALARRLLAENGNPPPRFEAHESHVLAEVRRTA